MSQRDGAKRKRLLGAAKPGVESGSGTNMTSFEVQFTSCDFFNNADLSDLKLNVNDGVMEFYVHRVIISSRSDYFKKMFTGEWKESESKSLDLTIEEEYEPVFENFLKFMYGLPIDISKENLWLYYFMADEYLVPDLTRACAAYVRENLNISKRRVSSREGGSSAIDAQTCFSLSDVADIFETFRVDVVKTYCAANIFARIDVIEDSLWVTFSKELVCAVLNSDMCTVTEQELFLKAVVWLRHEESRTEHAEDVLSVIRYSHMPTGSDLFAAQMYPLVVSSPTLTARVAAGCHYKFMKREISSEDFAKSPEFKKKQYLPRRYRKADTSRLSNTPS